MSELSRSRGLSHKEAALAIALSAAAGAGLAHGERPRESAPQAAAAPPEGHVSRSSRSNREKSSDTQLFATEGARFEMTSMQVTHLVQRDLILAFTALEEGPEVTQSEGVRDKADRVVSEALLAARGHILDALRREFQMSHQKTGFYPTTEELLAFERALSADVSVRIIEQLVDNPSTPIWHPLHKEAIEEGFGAWLAALDPRAVANADKLASILSQTRETTEDGVIVETSNSQPVVLDPEMDAELVRRAQGNEGKDMPAPPGRGYTIPTTRRSSGS